MVSPLIKTFKGQSCIYEDKCAADHVLPIWMFLILSRRVHAVVLDPGVMPDHVGDGQIILLDK